MTRYRKLAVTAVVGLGPILLAALVAGPATAHGALAEPVTRALACGTEAPQTAQSPACQAARAAGGDRAFADWYNLRVANVGGRDRELIPDGRLCSAGLDEFRSLDLARPDWPASTLTAGAPFTFRYRQTIAHSGTFRLYVTRDGYDPTQPLQWSQLESTPFLTVTDPPLQGSSYVLAGTLPAGRTGRHIIYTIWQTSSTPDTYYSCSDVVFTGASPGSSPPAPPTQVQAQGVAAVTSPAGSLPAAHRTSGTSGTGLLTAGRVTALGAVGLVALVAAVVMVVRRRRRN